LDAEEKQSEVGESGKLKMENGKLFLK